MSGRHSLFTQVLCLAKKWVFPKAPQDFTASHFLRSNTDSVTRAVSNTGFLVIEALGALVLRGAEGLDKIALLAVNKEGLVSFLHSIILVGDSAYEDGPGELFVIRGYILADGLPAIVRFEAIHFAANSSFVGTLRLEFEGHLAGLTSSLPQDFEDSAHKPVVEGEEDGARLVKSHGLALVPCATAEIALEQGPRAPITEVVSRAFPGLRIQDRAFDPALD